MRRLLLLFLMLAACREAPEKRDVVEARPSPCAEQKFEGSAFLVCRAGGPVEIRSGMRSFADLIVALGPRVEQVAFAMNAGMFDESGAPIGLLIEDGKVVHAVNRREGGGNFHLMPNGIFAVGKDGTAAVTTTPDYREDAAIAFATQSGPMLLIDGQLHPKFDTDGTSQYIRNAVGIGADGKPIFVISREPVSFGKLARFYRDALGANNALYLDGSVSSLWDPANDRLDAFTELGPMVVAFKPNAGSRPGRAGRATP